MSDRNGWWNLYRERDGRVEALQPMAAGFGEPQWQFGVSMYGFDAEGRIVCVYQRGGRSHLARIEPRSGALAVAWPRPNRHIDFAWSQLRARSGAKVGLPSDDDEPPMKTIWRTLWQQQSIVVYCDDLEVDRVAADSIERVYLVYRGAGDTPGDVDTSIVELRGEHGFVLFEARTGFAGRVNFERQAFWQQRACVYWVRAPSAALPWRMRLGGWRSEASSRPFRRLERAELDGCIAGWTLEGPEIWEDRKKQRIERSRPFGLDSVWKAAA